MSDQELRALAERMANALTRGLGNVPPGLERWYLEILADYERWLDEHPEGSPDR